MPLARRPFLATLAILAPLAAPPAAGQDFEALLDDAVMAAAAPRNPGSHLSETVTLPGREATLSFAVPGRLAEMRVRDGDEVTAGQVVARLDTGPLDAAIARLRAEPGAASALALAEAEAQKSLRVLEAPFAGRVEWALSPDTAALKESANVARVVALDTLRVSLQVPWPAVRQFALAPGTAAHVFFPVDPERLLETDGRFERVEGEVAFVGRVLGNNPPSVRVSVTLPNPHGRPAGEKVRVLFVRPPEPDTERDDAASGAPAEHGESR